MDALEKLREERRREFIEACWRNINDAIELGNQKVALAKMASKDFKEMVDKTAKTLKEQGADPQVIAEVVKAMSKMGDIPLAHISTYIGTLYDKQALAQGDPRSEIRQKTLPDGGTWTNEKARNIKRETGISQVNEVLEPGGSRNATTEL